MSDISKPAYLMGRGRGRGAINGGVSLPDASTVDGRVNNYAAAHSERSDLITSVRFENVKSRHQLDIQRHLTEAAAAAGENGDYLSSSSSDEDGNASETEVIELVKTSFRTPEGDTACVLGRTENYLVNAFNTKANICLICIESVKRNHQVWNCTGCYTIFHIQCIQKWVKDGVYQQSALSEEHFPNRDLPWFCPKCRYEYSQRDCPREYRCYCGKVSNPVFDPWLVPHSCGKECGRQLKPNCGHSCRLLCHPGPCPPCPQVVKVGCYCRKMSPQVRRCGAAEWSCGKPCLKPLICGQHSCNLPCHSGPCLVCSKTSKQSCQCCRNSAVRPCESPVWQCTEVCGNQLICGHHTCAEVCHAGPCSTCPSSGKRTCPCGKSKFDLPCTEEAPTCLETCNKLLECQRHYCTERCHACPCGTCREMVRKKCRCGKRDREIQCYKEFQCDVKCNNYRDCRVHQCKRKCCDGNCPPCTQVCGKTLGCRQHKCPSDCHRGPCYPCPVVVDVFCTCRKTKVSVPCGAEKSTRPPKCRQFCQKPPDCHHESRVPHRCHMGQCPPCQQKCDRIIETCQHRCLESCHSAVLSRVDKDQSVRYAGPWEKLQSQSVKWQLVAKPCPPCSTPVTITCLGKHESWSLECSKSGPQSCRRPCGRLLSCKNHTCQLECHVVTDESNSQTAGIECETCEVGCGRPRPAGCTHSCVTGSCHEGHCPSCTRMLRMRCHCGLVVLHVECHKWTQTDQDQRAQVQSCKGQCPKTLQCGHRCTRTCHPSPCNAVQQTCVEKVKRKCRCGNRKVDMKCHEIQSGNTVIDCDAHCQRKKQQLEEQLAAEEERKRLEVLKQQEQAELEEAQRRSRGARKSRGRRRQDMNDDDDEEGFIQSLIKISTSPLVILPILTVIFAAFVYWLIQSDA